MKARPARMHDSGIIEVFADGGAICGTRRNYTNAAPDKLVVKSKADVKVTVQVMQQGQMGSTASNAIATWLAFTRLFAISARLKLNAEPG